MGKMQQSPYNFHGFSFTQTPPDAANDNTVKNESQRTVKGESLPMFTADLMGESDAAYMTGIRRELHAYPEVGFELPRTIALVKRELNALGIEYSEEYGRCSVVALINGQCRGFTIGLRADMDALPVEETNDLPFKSKNEGMMHACGHDAHTAMLLGAARTLKQIESALSCRVKLLFQPSEEGEVSGARMMTENGAVDDVDVILGLHVDPMLEVGQIRVCPGAAMASCTPIEIDFSGKSAHATMPQKGCDALAMAVKAYLGIQIMLAREIDPFKNYICSVGALNAGHAHNVICGAANMKITLRAYDEALSDFIVGRIRTIAEHAAAVMGGAVKLQSHVSAHAVVNHPEVCRCLVGSAEKVVGTGRVGTSSPRLGSEDFSWFLRKKPGALFLLGAGNARKGISSALHCGDFAIDEDALLIGSRTFFQFVLDNMGGMKL
jgi:amidohydrolase